MYGMTFKSFNATTLAADDYRVRIWAADNKQFQSGSSAVFVPRGHRASVYATQQRKERQIILTIESIDAANRQAHVGSLLALFDSSSNQTKKLIVTDKAGTPADWYMYCKVVDHILDGVLHKIVLVAPDGIWFKDSVTTPAAWAITASPDTEVYTPGGTHPPRPTITITPTSARSGDGLGYRRHVQIVSQADGELSNYPINITGTVLDTDALVTAGKMQADGDDIRVFVDGKSVPYWLSGINTVNTKIWSVFNFAEPVTLDLLANMGAGAITEIGFANTPATRKLLRKLPGEGWVRIGSEVFAYGATDVGIGYGSGVDLINAKLTGVERAQWQTTAATHTAGDDVEWVQHEVKLAYGNSSLAAPSQSNKKKPIFALTSTNTSWVYAEFLAAQVTTPENPNQRTAQWDGDVLRSTGRKSLIYTGNRGAEAIPATEMGMHAINWQQGSQWRGEEYLLEWSIYHPCGVTTVALDGEKYRVGTNWPTVSLLQVSTDGKTWISTAQTVTTPASASTWTAWSTSGALGATYNYLRFRMRGTLAAVSGVENYIEVENATLTLDSTKTPEVTLGGELASTYQLEFVLENTTTGEKITVDYPVKLDSALVIDCLNKTARYKGGNVFGALEIPGGQAEWMTLNVGANTLKYTESGVGAVTVQLTWRERDGGM